MFKLGRYSVHNYRISEATYNKISCKKQVIGGIINEESRRLRITYKSGESYASPIVH